MSDDQAIDLDSAKSSAQGAQSKDVLPRMRARFKLAQDAWEPIFKVALEDFKFRKGDQWPEEIRRQRDLQNRPCLTVNRLPAFIRQITNDQRQNRNSADVNPVDDEATIEIANILEGMVRHIEDDSHADSAFDTAFDCAATGGFGWWRILTAYQNERSFNQKLLVGRVPNPFSVLADPSFKAPDGSDMNWGFVVDDVSIEQFKSDYPNSLLSKMNDWKAMGQQSEGWVEENGCRVVEYYEKTFRPETLLLLSNGETVLESEISGELPEGVFITKKRKTILPAICWYKSNGIEILDETDWLGRWIPLVPVLGDEMFIEGERVLEGLIRHAKDPQRMYNYWKSAETEAIALAPRAPWVGAEGQFEGHPEWDSANTVNHSKLEYKPVSIDGEMAPPPQRIFGEPAVQSITNASLQASEDIKATTGLWDPTLGRREGDPSGIAVQRLNQQAQTSNFHFIDNLRKSIRHSTRMQVELIPKIYDTPQAVRIIHPDGEHDMVMINQIFVENGQQKQYRLDLGEYDVSVSSGPSYQTKRQEALAAMMDLIKEWPQAAPMIADLLALNMDWDGAKEISERFKTMLPPQIQNMNSNGEEPLPPQVQQQMTQMRQLIQQLTGQLHEAIDVIDKKKLELQSREKIEFAKLDVDLRKSILDHSVDEARLPVEHQMDLIARKLDLIAFQKNVSNPVSPGASSAGLAGNQTNQPGGNPAAANLQPPTGGSAPTGLTG